ncbi:MAG TPA: threonine synthase [Methylomusa anaerophila]|uniref:Threonine synthase n=1 Tax=Methylomusa anaerophila TaxID=1930071 RepID=A0A348ANF8_9FIRM|nr:threonine synthase [Methylomusa anaerophila]BBB92606.1 threonine synthase [Methylomusa anaerophila]HML87540.1 threonine synthase [Methylomusa anaerophila]
MKYISTRGAIGEIESAAAIAAGIAPDGGLYVPGELPTINLQGIGGLLPLSYQERAVKILSLFLSDYSYEDLVECVTAAYNLEKFDSPAVAPVVTVGNNTHMLELWHGPTSAFKDMALQLLPHLLSKALTKIGEQAEIVILVATSGDTGKAALDGFKDVERIKVIVFYPEHGVSQIQRLQMVTQQGGNLSVIAVRGNFDDTQTGVKEIFNDPAFNYELLEHDYKLSSANSINWGRLVPQIIYYFSAYCDLVREQHVSWGQPVNFVVPTGNFGNILAGYYAKLMGLPINRLICASNSNNVLTEFINTGTYNRNRPFHKTYSPSMDILISSNLERLLFHISAADSAKVQGWMEQLRSTGMYQIEAEYFTKIKEIFFAGYVDDTETTETIRQVFNDFNYVLDPHTAVAWRIADNYRLETGDGIPNIIVSTASPFKFNATVLAALSASKSLSEQAEFGLLAMLASLTGWKVPRALSELEHLKVLHKYTCDKDKMYLAVRDALAGLKK